MSKQKAQADATQAPQTGAPSGLAWSGQVGGPGDRRVVAIRRMLPERRVGDPKGILNRLLQGDRRTSVERRGGTERRASAMGAAARSQMTPAAVIGTLPRTGGPVFETVKQVFAAVKVVRSNGLPVPDTMPLGQQVSKAILAWGIGKNAQVDAVAVPVVDCIRANGQAQRTLLIHQGNGQIAKAGAVLPIQPAVRLIDGFGQPVAQVDVTFQAQGGGSVPSPTVRTEADGVARTSWTMGTQGCHKLVATIGGTAPPAGGRVEFTAVAV